MPAWKSYWRVRDRLVATLLSVYVLAAFVLAGAGRRRGLYFSDTSVGPAVRRDLTFFAVSSPARKEAALPDLGALSAMSDAVESGLGLPEVVRAAARALDASLVLIDRSSSVLAVAARSTADERTLMRDADGRRDARAARRRRGRRPAAAAARAAARRRRRVLRIATTMIASEVERLRAPDRASEAAQAAFLTALFQRKVTDRGDILARASELGADLSEGGAVVVVRAHHFAPADDDWRARVLAAAERAARAGAPGSLAAVLEGPADPQGHVVVLLPTAQDAGLRRVAEGIARELHASVHGFTFALGHSRVAHDPVDLYRAGNEALLAANVATANRSATTSRCSRSRTPAPTGCCCPR